MAWSRVTASSKQRHHQSGLHASQFDMYREFEEMDLGDDDFSQAEYSCPFCAGDFDAVGLCCHIDEDHPVEVKNGVCPICSSRIGSDFAAHITLQHGSFFKIQRKRKPGRGSLGSYSAFSLKKESREPHIQALFGGSTYAGAGLQPSSSVPDPLLSSFIYNPQSMDLAKDVVKHVKFDDDDDDHLSNKNVDKQIEESSRPSLSDKDKKEKAQRSEFVQELLWSTIFPGSL